MGNGKSVGDALREAVHASKRERRRLYVFYDKPAGGFVVEPIAPRRGGYWAVEEDRYHYVKPVLLAS